MIFTSFIIKILFQPLPFGSTADISFSLCTAASSSDSRLGRLLPTLSMSANRPLLLLLLLEGLSCWSVLIEGGMGLREFWVPLYIWFPGKQLGYIQFTVYGKTGNSVAKIKWFVLFRLSLRKELWAACAWFAAMQFYILFSLCSWLRHTL